MIMRYNDPSARFHHSLVVSFCSARWSQANSFHEVNIELRGNVQDFTCAVVAGDSNKSNNPAPPTKQLHAAGDATQPVAFSLNLKASLAGVGVYNVFRDASARHGITGAC